MKVSILKEVDRNRWDSYILSRDNASCYHLTAWQNVVESSFGHRTYYLMAEEGGTIRGILPIVQMKSLLFGNFMVSLPYFNYGGICADDEDTSKFLLEEAIRIAIQEGAEHIELRHTRKIDYNLQVKTSKVSMRIELPIDTEELWKSFPSKLRAQVKKPEKEGMFSQFGREEELDNFYHIFSVNMKSLGTPVYSKEFFRNILKKFPDSTSICTIYAKDRVPIAAGFIIGFRDMMEIPWASSIKDYNRYSPNMLLYWKILEHACKSGFKQFDFGRSTPGEGTYKFKEQWGAKPIQLYWHYWLRKESSIPELNPKNSKYRLAVRIWQKLPLTITKLLGPSIVRNIP